MFRRRVHNYLSQRGQSLLEVVMVAFILVMALVALISLTTVSIARNRLAKERTVATRLAQEGLEWFKYERDRLGFEAMTSFSGEYCLNSFPSGGFELLPQTCDPGASFVNVGGSEQVFTRKLVISDAGPEEVKVSVVVEFRSKKVTLEGAVKKWER